MRTRRPSIVLALSLALTLGTVSGCASSDPRSLPASGARGGAFDDVQRLVIVASGESRFTGVHPSKDSDRAFDDVVKWLPYKELLLPIAKAVYSGVSSLMDADRGSRTAPRDVTPGVVVAESFVRTLKASVPLYDIRVFDREPVGDDRRRADAVLRVTVPAWGFVRVRDGSPEVVASFADVRAEMVLRESGVVIWDHAEDVTHPERLSPQTVGRDRAFTREELVDVLERAGRRLANEFIYARGGRR